MLRQKWCNTMSETRPVSAVSVCQDSRKRPPHKWLWLAAASALLVTTNAFANFTCSGKVAYLGLSPDGVMTLSVSGFGVWYICSMSGPYGNAGHNAEGCKAWYASALAAQKSGQGIVLYFQSPSGTSNGTDCTALGSWVIPNPGPYHLQVLGQ
jgi:hypothetical protein